MTAFKVTCLVGLWALVVACSDTGNSGITTQGTGGGSGTGGSGAGATSGAGPTGCANPCGGDIVGTWTAKSVCGDVKAMFQNGSFSEYPACAGAVSAGAVDSLSVSWTFASNGTYTMTNALTESATFVINSACATAIAGQAVTVNATFCQEYTTALQDQGYFTSVSCPFQAGSCVCSLTMANAGTENGNYTISGSSITTIPADGTAYTQQYCVQGSTMNTRDTSNMGFVFQKS